MRQMGIRGRGVSAEGWAARYVECEVPKEVVVVSGCAVGNEERLAEREESAEDMSDFYGTMYDKLRERSARPVGDKTTDRNQQKSATKRPSIQPPMAPRPVRERYGKRPGLSDTDRVTVRRDLLRPGSTSGASRAGAPRADEDPD